MSFSEENDIHWIFIRARRYSFKHHNMWDTLGQHLHLIKKRDNLRAFLFIPWKRVYSSYLTTSLLLRITWNCLGEYQVLRKDPEKPQGGFAYLPHTAAPCTGGASLRLYARPAPTPSQLRRHLFACHLCLTGSVFRSHRYGFCSLKVCE